MGGTYTKLAELSARRVTPSPAAALSPPAPLPAGAHQRSATIELLAPNDDVMTSSHHNVNTSERHHVMTSPRHEVTPDFKRWKATVENTEVQSSSLRLSVEEKEAVEDFVRLLRRDHKMRTSLNELARLGILYLMHDFQMHKKQSIIAKVKEQ